MAAALALIHSPLVGPVSWEPVADVLRRRGVAVVVPELARPAAAPFCRQQAEAAVEQLERLPHGQPVLLAGHSGAGALLPAIRDRAARPVAGTIFVDAGIPRDGERRAGAGDFAAVLRALYDAGQQFPSWTDDDLREVIPDPGLRRCLLASLRPQPWPFWDEPIAVPRAWPDVPCGYLRFGDNPAYADSVALARELGWPVGELDGRHFHLLVDPEAVAGALIALAGWMGVAVR